MKLADFFQKNPEVAIAFSGGVDSTYLLYAAKKYGTKVKAYLIHSAFQPEFEIEDAVLLAEQLDVPLHIEKVDVLGRENVAANHRNRCYLCKKVIFGRLWELARADGFAVLCDGTNGSDNYDERPGMKALEELGVISPLRDCGISKTGIRQLSEKAGLPTYAKAAYACLATRVPSGTTITADILKRVEHAEKELFVLEYKDFRVRYGGEMAKLQMLEKDFPRVVKQQEEIRHRLSPYFKDVMLDLTPREPSE